MSENSCPIPTPAQGRFGAIQSEAVEEVLRFAEAAIGKATDQARAAMGRCSTPRETITLRRCDTWPWMIEPKTSVSETLREAGARLLRAWDLGRDLSVAE